MSAWYDTLSPLGQNLLAIFTAFALAWLVQRASGRLAQRLVGLNRFTTKRGRLRSERLETLRGLIAGVIGFLAFLVALVFTLSLFVDTATLIWVIGLFSAAFGLGARPLVSDYLTGINLLFEDPFDVGEKVELHGLIGGSVEGVIEQVKLRSTYLRAPSGELYSIPNGEIRVVRNFSRGRFSMSNIILKINSDDLGRAIPLLEELGQEAMSLLPNLLEPWRVISPSGTISQHTELTLAAKAYFGKAAEMRPRLLTLVQERLHEANITLAE